MRRRLRCCRKHNIPENYVSREYNYVNMISGFKACGIHPWNPLALPVKAFTPCNFTDTELSRSPGEHPLAWVVREVFEQSDTHSLAPVATPVGVAPTGTITSNVSEMRQDTISPTSITPKTMRPGSLVPSIASPAPDPMLPSTCHNKAIRDGRPRPPRHQGFIAISYGGSELRHRSILDTITHRPKCQIQKL